MAHDSIFISYPCYPTKLEREIKYQDDLSSASSSRNLTKPSAAVSKQ
uniref:Uncharacterized protein n=1 Tax=Nothoprocta perdicaria TaxID=30464 RepID=A0A8C6ZLK6_NOTPE